VGHERLIFFPRRLTIFDIDRIGYDYLFAVCRISENIPAKALRAKMNDFSSAGTSPTKVSAGEKPDIFYGQISPPRGRLLPRHKEVVKQFMILSELFCAGLCIPL
jgi:hypothetical protein